MAPKSKRPNHLSPQWQRKMIDPKETGLNIFCQDDVESNFGAS